MSQGPRRKVHLDDIETLLGAGEAPLEIARRLGVRPKSIAGVIHKRVRAGEYDESARRLASAFESAARLDGPARFCSCGTRIAHNNRSGNCVRCANHIKQADPAYRAKLAESARRVSESRDRDAAGKWIS